MTRTTFLTIAACIGLAVGLFALIAPSTFLATKGVVDNPAAAVWMREVGVLILAVSLLGLAVRSHPPSPTLRAVLLANALVQAGLLPIELAAWSRGVITTVSGVAPNSVLHVTLSLGFLWFSRLRS
jgi:hypothetical protein